MKQILNYNIHNILKFQIASNKWHDIARNLNLPFSFFEIKDKLNNPDIILNVGKFTPSNKGCYFIDHKYHIKQNYFYCKDSDGRVSWEVEIFGFEDGNTVINFDSKFLGPESLIFPHLLLPQEMILKPMIAYKLSQKGFFLVHAGGVSRENYAYIFAGRGGSGKTSLILDFVNSGYKYLGDDWVILNKEKRVLCFPVNLGQFSFSKKTGILVTESHSSFLDKIRFLWYLHYLPNYDNVPLVKSSYLKALFLVSKANNPTANVKLTNTKEATSILLSNNIAEYMTSPSIMGRNFGRFYTYMLAYSFVFPNNKIARYWNGLGTKLKEIVKGIPIYEIRMARKCNFNEIKRFIEESMRCTL
jgi:hypothetical protein